MRVIAFVLLLLFAATLMSGCGDDDLNEFLYERDKEADRMFESQREYRKKREAEERRP